MDVGSTSDAAGAGGGLAALMMAANPSLTPEQMKAAMIAGVDTIPSMQGQLVSNVRRAALIDCACLHSSLVSAASTAAVGLHCCSGASQACAMAYRAHGCCQALL